MSDEEKRRGRPRCFEKCEALDAALEVFHKRGYEGCSLDDLTDAMGINRPSLYAAFGNKEQLFIAVLRKYYGAYREYVDSLLSEDLPPREMVRKWLSWFLKNSRKQKEPLGCLIVNSTLLISDSYPKISDELKNFHELNEKRLSEYFEREIEKGRLSGDAKGLSQYFNAVVQGMAVLQRGRGDSNILENIASNALNAIPE